MFSSNCLKDILDGAAALLLATVLVVEVRLACVDAAEMVRPGAVILAAAVEVAAPKPPKPVDVVFSVVPPREKLVAGAELTVAVVVVPPSENPVAPGAEDVGREKAGAGVEPVPPNENPETEAVGFPPMAVDADKPSEGALAAAEVGFPNPPKPAAGTAVEVAVPPRENPVLAAEGVPPRENPVLTAAGVPPRENPEVEAAGLPPKENPVAAGLAPPRVSPVEAAVVPPKENPVEAVEVPPDENPVVGAEVPPSENPVEAAGAAGVVAAAAGAPKENPLAAVDAPGWEAAAPSGVIDKPEEPPPKENPVPRIR